ncbi:70bb58a4-6ccd-4888-8a78-faf15ab313ed [Sclerotinia trifoliorum]|uniref:70bb58a4-6ccd-4888-8a78-faf15ab313ed n=1 Tax=Sclerotinia trifoliorum TaxID=28548 RepID=A0A8H2W3N9_9HELO|nr:70bb58a4-6ccd-4888-8a78-faf15ab313ed [Sclerotinia trifoliorum]
MAQELDPDTFTSPWNITETLHRDPYWAIDPKNPANVQNGKIIIITGASSGIGAAAAKVWAEAHASGIVLAARGVPAMESLIRELQPLSPETKFLAVKVDIANEDDVKNLYTAVQKEFGRHADVLMNNAGIMEIEHFIGETEPSRWWKILDTNLKGLYQMTHHYMASQPTPKTPTGTIINVSSLTAGLTLDRGTSSYSISKLCDQRFSEFLVIEYPSLRVFTTMPGVAATKMVPDYLKPCALDHVDLTGMLALYLVQERADFLRGSMVSVNWDVEELEEYKKEIVEKKLLQTTWMPVFPVGGVKKLAEFRD